MRGCTCPLQGTNQGFDQLHVRIVDHLGICMAVHGSQMDNGVTGVYKTIQGGRGVKIFPFKGNEFHILPEVQGVEQMRTYKTCLSGYSNFHAALVLVFKRPVFQIKPVVICLGILEGHIRKDKEFRI